MSDRASQTHYRPLIGADVQASIELWRRSPGVGLSGADDPAELASFLQQNHGLCWCAEKHTELVGTVLCGSDGRRGYIYHLAVAETARRNGIGRALVDAALSSVAARGISRCHAMVFANNRVGRSFWQEAGWRLREELVTFSIDPDQEPQIWPLR